MQTVIVDIELIENVDDGKVSSSTLILWQKHYGEKNHTLSQKLKRTSRTVHIAGLQSFQNSQD